jgi:GDP/UDP-N,N'-diacetylbacillosamine 2-epimerase (hydrolysing)
MIVKKNVVIFTGARSDYGLLKNIIKRLKFFFFLKVQVVAGPDHFENKFGLTFQEIINDKIKIDYEIKNNRSKKIFNQKLSNLFNKFNKLLSEKKIDCVILLGDRYETFLFASCCYLNKIPIIHLYGGEKTFGAIDESLRHAITKLSFIHFVASENNKKRLVRLGEDPKLIFNFGYTGVENFLKIKLRSKKYLFKKYDINTKKKIILVTFHPETISKISYEKQIQTLIEGIVEIKDVYFLFNMNNSDPGSEVFLREINRSKKIIKNMKIIKSLGVQDYASFVNISNMVVGNSSSGIIEVPYLNKFSINIGDRQQGRDSKDTVINIKLKSKIIKKNILKYINKFPKKKKYSIINSSKLISNKIVSLMRDNKISFKKKIFYEKN